jgi:hypothetical protein
MRTNVVRSKTPDDVSNHIGRFLMEVNRILAEQADNPDKSDMREISQF